MSGGALASPSIARACSAVLASPAICKEGLRRISWPSTERSAVWPSTTKMRNTVRGTTRARWGAAVADINVGATSKLM